MLGADLFDRPVGVLVVAADVRPGFVGEFGWHGGLSVGGARAGAGLVSVTSGAIGIAKLPHSRPSRLIVNPMANSTTTALVVCIVSVLFVDANAKIGSAASTRQQRAPTKIT